MAIVTYIIVLPGRNREQKILIVELPYLLRWLIKSREISMREKNHGKGHHDLKII